MQRDYWGAWRLKSLQVGNHLDEASKEMALIPTSLPAQNKFHVD